MKYSDPTTTGDFVAYSEYFRIEDSNAFVADKVSYLVKLYMRLILIDTLYFAAVCRQAVRSLQQCQCGSHSRIRETVCISQR